MPRRVDTIRFDVKRYDRRELTVDFIYQAFCRDKRDVTENKVTNLLVT